jgi:hypothetical protein
LYNGVLKSMSLSVEVSHGGLSQKIFSTSVYRGVPLMG